MAKLKVEVIVGLIDKLTGPLGALSGKLKKASLGLGVGGAAATFAGKQILDPISAAVKASTDLSGALAEVRIVSGATAEAIAGIRPEIRKIAVDSIQGTDAVAGSLKDLVAKGLGLQEAMGALPAVGKSATAADAEIADMTNTAAALMQNLKIQSGDVQKSLDMLTVAGNEGAFELKDMARELPTLTASMSILGQTGEEAVGTLGAALQVVRRGAGDSAQAANNLNNLLQKIAAPTTIKKLKKEYGVDLPAALKTWEAEGKNTFEEFLKLTKQLTGGDAVKLGKIFEDMQVKAALAPLLQGMDDYREIKAKAEAALGAVDKQFAIRLSDDPRLRMERLTIQLSNLTDRIGTALLPAIERLVQVAIPWVDKLGTWIDENRDLAASIALTVAGLGGALVVLGPRALALAAVFGAMSITAGALARFPGLLGALKGAAMFAAAPIGRLAQSMRMARNGAVMLASSRGIGAVSIALRALATVFLSTPIGWMSAALAGAAALIYKYWAPIKGFFAGFWDGLTSGLGDIGGSVQSAFAPIMPAIQPFIDGFGWLVDKISEILQPVEDVGGAAEDMGRRFGAVAAQIITLPARIIAEFMRIPARLGEITAQLVQVGSDWVAGLWRGMQAKWAEFTSWVTGKVNSIAGIFRKETKTKSPSRVFADIGKDLMAGLQLGLEQRSGQVVGQVGKLAGALAAVPLVISPVAAQDMTGAAATLQKALSELQAPAIAGVVQPALSQMPQLLAGTIPSAARPQAISQPLPKLGGGPSGAQPTGGTATGGRGAVTITMPVTITIQAPPGADEHAIGALINRHMESVSGRLVRKLSSFYDDEDDV